MNLKEKSIYVEVPKAQQCFLGTLADVLRLEEEADRTWEKRTVRFHGMK